MKTKKNLNEELIRSQRIVCDVTVTTEKTIKWFIHINCNLIYFSFIFLHYKLVKQLFSIALCLILSNQLNITTVILGCPTHIHPYQIPIYYVQMCSFLIYFIFSVQLCLLNSIFCIFPFTNSQKSYKKNVSIEKKIKNWKN